MSDATVPDEIEASAILALRTAPDPGARESAARRLRGRRSEASLQALVHALDDDGVEEVQTGEGGPPMLYPVATAAREALEESIDVALPLLLAHAPRATSGGRWEIARALARAGPVAAPWLTQATRDASAPVRACAVGSLAEGWGAAPPREVLCTIADRLLDVEHLPITAAAGALGRLRSPETQQVLRDWLTEHSDAEERLFAMIREERGDWARAAVMALSILPLTGVVDLWARAYLMAKDPVLRTDLAAQLEKRDAELGESTRAALREAFERDGGDAGLLTLLLKTATAKELPSLVAAALSRFVTHQQLVSLALSIAEERGVTVAEEVLGVAFARLRDDDAQRSLALARDRSIVFRSALPVLIDRLASANRRDAPADAAERLGEMGPEAAAAVPALIGLFTTAGSLPVQDAAAEALVQIRVVPEILPWVRRRLVSSIDTWRAQALSIVPRLGPDATPLVPDLANILRRDGDARFWGPALDALAAIGPSAAAAVPAIANRLDDATNGAKAVATLRAIGRAAIAAEVELEVVLAETGREDVAALLAELRVGQRPLG